MKRAGSSVNQGTKVTCIGGPEKLQGKLCLLQLPDIGLSGLGLHIPTHPLQTLEVCCSGKGIGVSEVVLCSQDCEGADSCPLMTVVFIAGQLVFS